MPHRSHRHTILLFGALAAYITLQTVWWGVLLVRKDREAARLAMEVRDLGGDAASALDATRGLRMVVGEGVVLLVLLVLLLLLTFRAVRRDLALARTQRNFLMAVTHELRTPIAAIKLQLQTLVRPGTDAGQREAMRTMALREADRLSLLTEKVLLAARADEGALDLETAEVEVMGLLRELVEQVRAQAALAHTVSLKGPERLAVRSDPHALRSIAGNLIENAAKYAPAGTAIDVEVEAGRDGWRLLVGDEGPGIPAGERERVFEKFHRGGDEATRRAKGTGLGLYIVRSLVRRLGGTVHVRAREPQGATFAASFPNR